MNYELQACTLYLVTASNYREVCLHLTISYYAQAHNFSFLAKWFWAFPLGGRKSRVLSSCPGDRRMIVPKTQVWKHAWQKSMTRPCQIEKLLPTNRSLLGKLRSLAKSNACMESYVNSNQTQRGEESEKLPKFCQDWKSMDSLSPQRFATPQLGWLDQSRVPSLQKQPSVVSLVRLALACVLLMHFEKITSLSILLNLSGFHYHIYGEEIWMILCDLQINTVKHNTAHYLLSIEVHFITS